MRKQSDPKAQQSFMLFSFFRKKNNFYIPCMVSPLKENSLRELSIWTKCVLTMLAELAS